MPDHAPPLSPSDVIQQLRASEEEFCSWPSTSSAAGNWKSSAAGRPAPSVSGASTASLVQGGCERTRVLAASVCTRVRACPRSRRLHESLFEFNQLQRCAAPSVYAQQVYLIRFLCAETPSNGNVGPC